MRKIASILIILFIIPLASCAGSLNQQKGSTIGTAVGAGVGAILGQAIGRDTGGTLLGAGIGAILGGIAGNQAGVYMDRQEQDLREALAASDAANVRRVKEAVAASEARGDQKVNDVLVATFKSEVLFDFNSATLKPGAYGEIARVAGVLKKYPQTTIMVEGHADTRGNEIYNQELSKKRADAVRDALIQQGVDGSRIESVGYGETQPISSDNALNRRVTIVIKPVVKAMG